MVAVGLGSLWNSWSILVIATIRKPQVQGGIDKLQRFLFQNSDINFEEVNLFDSDFNSCATRLTCLALLSTMQEEMPFRVVTSELIKSVEGNTRNLNILTEETSSNSVRSLFKGVSPSSLSQNVWIITHQIEKLTTEKDLTWLVEEIIQEFTNKLRINSQVYIMFIIRKGSSFEVKILEVYRIGKGLPLLVRSPNGGSIWERRKNLMGLEMKIGLIRGDSPNMFRIFYSMGEVKKGVPYFAGKSANGSRMFVTGSNVEYLKIFQAAEFTKFTILKLIKFALAARLCHKVYFVNMSISMNLGCHEFHPYILRGDCLWRL